MTSCDTARRGGSTLIDGHINHEQLNLHQRRWLELLKDYDMNVHYHPGNANVVADVLSRMSMVSTAHVEDERLGERLVDSTSGGVSVHPSS